ncbi:MAG: YfjI family protein [Chloroflexota bacterium]|nr:YfjI family protein [Chloroflexota bacterium]
MKQQDLWGDGQVISSMKAEFGRLDGSDTWVEANELRQCATGDSHESVPASDDGVEPQLDGKIEHILGQGVHTIVTERTRDHEPTISVDLPSLPESAYLSPELGKDACAWLDEYIAFSRHWSPRSYDDFHEACALWLLAAIAARRVTLSFGGQRYTNLYIALCARTSLWAKSTAAKIAMDTIRAADLDFLLAPDDSTPQALIQSMTQRVPEDYAALSEKGRAVVLQRIAFAAQPAWFYEEFGQKLSSMMRENGPMADYRGLFRRLDDCPDRYRSATIGRGTEAVHQPYLSLLANLTLPDLAPYARKNGALWGDGFFARFGFVAPPADAAVPAGRFPKGQRNIPESLVQPLKDWHHRLGTPVVNVEEQVDKQGNRNPTYEVVISPHEPEHITYDEDVYEAYYRYDDALRAIVQGSANSDLDGNYMRLAEKALRIAMLLASIDNHGHIQMRHWTRSQQIAERWRVSLHALIDQLQNVADVSREAELEDKVIRVLQQHGSVTVNDIRKNALRTASSQELSRILDSLVAHGRVTASSTRKGTKRYSLLDANSAKVEIVNGVQPPDSYTISRTASNGVGTEDSCHRFTVTPLHDSSSHLTAQAVSGKPVEREY